jgi:hypothetical protein
MFINICTHSHVIRGIVFVHLHRQISMSAVVPVTVHVLSGSDLLTARWSRQMDLTIVLVVSYGQKPHTALGERRESKLAGQ